MTKTETATISQGQRVEFVYPASYPSLGGAQGVGEVLKIKQNGWVSVAPDRGRTMIQFPPSALTPVN